MTDARLCIHSLRYQARNAVNGVSLAQTRATRGPRNTRNSSWVFCTGRGLDLAEILPQHNPNLTQLLMDAIREARV